MSSLIQPAFSKGEVSPEIFGRVDTAAYKVGLATARNLIIRVSGGAINRPGLEFVGFATSNASTSRLRRFRYNSGDSYILEFSNLTMRVIRDDAFVLETPVAITAATAAYPVVISAVNTWSVGDDIEINGVVGMVRLNSRRFRVLARTSGTVALQDIITGLPLDGTAFAAYVSGGTVARVYTVVTPFVEADLLTLKFVQSADVLTINHPNYPEQQLGRISDNNWTLTTPTFAPSIAPPVGVTAVANVTGTTLDDYVVTVIDAITGEESYASASGNITNGNVTRNNAISWTASAGGSLYSVYRAVNGVYGFVGTSPNLTFNDTNLIPDLSTTPPTPPNPNPFSGAGNYPAVSSYYQQRQVRGGALNKPDTNFYSQVGAYYNLSVSMPETASDAITEVLASTEVNVIQHYVPIKADLICFTLGTEWRINASGSGFSATTSDQLPQSSWGCSYLEPIKIGLNILFVPENQITIRTFEYAFASDSYVGVELTLLANHIYGAPQFSGGPTLTMTAWGFGRSPDPVIFATRSDGFAQALTYQEDQQVTAWTNWDTQGLFEDVEVIRPSLAFPDDVPYFTVTRLVNGQRVRYIERLHSRRYSDVRDCFFVDAGLSYDNPVQIQGITNANPAGVTAFSHGFVNGQEIDIFDVVWAPVIDDLDNATQPDQLNGQRFIISAVTANTFCLTGVGSSGFNAYVSGGTARATTNTFFAADHLEGCPVAILADGNVVENMTVVNGSVTLPFNASRVHLGLKYIADLETLDLESPQGTIQGIFKRVANVTLRFNQSRGLFVGQDNLSLTEIKQRQFEDMGDPTALFSGDQVVTMSSDWNGNGRVFLRQRYPLPMDILDIIPTLDIGG